MKAKDIAHTRLLKQEISRHTYKKPEDIVGYMGAVQAQDYAAASWALGLRLPHATDAAIDDAFNKGTILRTHVMRPTWHFVLPHDIRWMQELTAGRLTKLIASASRPLGLDAKLFLKTGKLIAKALEGNNYLTRTEIVAMLEKAGIPTNENRMTHIMMQAELDQLICSGPRRGKQFTYALLAERAPKAQTMKRDAALAELALRYFSSHGPATLQDYAWWSGLTIKDAKDGLNAISSKLEQANIAGQAYWFSAPVAGTGKKVRAYLLPNFDEYTIAYKDRDAVHADPQAARKRMNVLFTNTIIIDAQIAGTWKRSFTKDSVNISLAPFEKLSKQQEEAVQVAAAHYAAFYNAKLVLV